jgi:hypothetical protein
LSALVLKNAQQAPDEKSIAKGKPSALASDPMNNEKSGQRTPGAEPCTLAELKTETEETPVAGLLEKTNNEKIQTKPARGKSAGVLDSHRKITSSTTDRRIERKSKPASEPAQLPNQHGEK